MTKSYKNAVPLGLEFLELSANHQDQCAKVSRKNLTNLENDINQLYENLGTLLSLLDRFASCFWGCHKREHVIESLVGRSVSSTRAALRLIEFGHYDEALTLTRGIAEIGNLIWLFFLQPDELRVWIDAPDHERRSRYSPVKVRIAIERAGSVVPHDQTEYTWLCEIAVHPTPETRPQSHNLHKIPTLGGFYQEKGQADCLVRLAWAVSSVAGPSAKMALLERTRAEEIVQATIRVVKALPELDEGSEILGSSSELLEKTKWLNANIRKKDDTN